MPGHQPSGSRVTFVVKGGDNEEDTPRGRAINLDKTAKFYIVESKDGAPAKRPVVAGPSDRRPVQCSRVGQSFRRYDTVLCVGYRGRKAKMSPTKEGLCAKRK